MTISVIGAGAFGTALAISLSQVNRPVLLWARDLGEMVETRVNSARLPSFAFPPCLTPTDDLTLACSSSIILLAIPMQNLAGFLDQHSELLASKTLVACCKGIDLSSGLGPSGLIQKYCTTAIPAALSGPSFAVDIAAGLPTALALAIVDGSQIQSALSTDNLRLYLNDDFTGVEIGGALKNVVAIACGIAVGAGLGESARAALMTRGFAEMNRFAQHKGARVETLSGLSGFGDLALTCSSEKSRNFAFGLALGQGDSLPEGTTVEGKATAKAVSIQAKNENIDMPIADTVVAVLDGHLTVKEAVESLLARPLKHEWS